MRLIPSFYRILSISLTLWMIGYTSGYSQPVDSIAILYNQDISWTQELLPALRQQLEALHDEGIKVQAVGYRKETLPGLYEDSIRHYPIVVGPFDSESVKVLSDYAKSTQQDKLSPYFICPTVSTPAASYPEIKFVNITTQEQERVSVLYEDLINKSSLTKVGLLFENDRWGTSIMNLLTTSANKFNQNVISLPLSSRNTITESDEIMKSFIRSALANDVKLIVLATQENQPVVRFLNLLDKACQGQLCEYFPTLVLFGDYALDRVSPALLRKFTVYGMTEVAEDSLYQLSEGEAIVRDAGALAVALLREEHDATSFRQRYEDCILRSRRFPPLDHGFVTQVFRSKLDQGASQKINLYQVQQASSGQLIKQVLSELAATYRGRLWHLNVLPFYRYQSLPRRSSFTLTFVLLAFLSFTLYTQRFYYTRFSWLIASPRFWLWFLINLIVTFVVLIALLHQETIMANAYVKMVAVALLCPNIINYAFDKLEASRMLGSTIHEFINVLRHNVDVFYERMFPQRTDQRVVNHITGRNSYQQILQATYRLIYSVRNLTLRRRIVNDLQKDLSVVQEPESEEVDTMDLKKDELTRFYLKASFYLAGSKDTFCEALTLSGLVEQDCIDLIREAHPAAPEPVVA